tara:strand:+ start:6258 stop:7853 length:1596 start_codon:yes stop_codon:yes gene_type:complete
MNSLYTQVATTERIGAYTPTYKRTAYAFGAFGALVLVATLTIAAVLLSKIILHDDKDQPVLSRRLLTGTRHSDDGRFEYEWGDFGDFTYLRVSQIPSGRRIVLPYIESTPTQRVLAAVETQPVYAHAVFIWTSGQDPWAAAYHGNHDHIHTVYNVSDHVPLELYTTVVNSKPEDDSSALPQGAFDNRIYHRASDFRRYGEAAIARGNFHNLTVTSEKASLPVDGAELNFSSSKTNTWTLAEKIDVSYMSALMFAVPKTDRAFNNSKELVERLSYESVRLSLSEVHTFLDANDKNITEQRILNTTDDSNYNITTPQQLNGPQLMRAATGTEYCGPARKTAMEDGQYKVPVNGADVCCYFHDSVANSQEVKLTVVGLDLFSLPILPCWSDKMVGDCWKDVIQKKLSPKKLWNKYFNVWREGVKVSGAEVFDFRPKKSLPNGVRCSSLDCVDQNWNAFLTAGSNPGTWPAIASTIIYNQWVCGQTDKKCKKVCTHRKWWGVCYKRHEVCTTVNEIKWHSPWVFWMRSTGYFNYI